MIALNQNSEKCFCFELNRSTHLFGCPVYEKELEEYLDKK